jgi:hypothetical protein
MISEKKSAVVRALKSEGLSVEQICERLTLKSSSVRRYLRHAKSKKTPKVFLLDIESATVWTRVWGLWRQRIPYQNIIKVDGRPMDWFMLCWAGKWLGDDKIISDSVTSWEATHRNDKRIARSIWKIIHEADVLIGHNLDRFDLRKIMHSAHNLDYLNSIFSLRMKEDTDYQLWIDCEEGDKEALAYMLHYCESDVLALEDLYLKLRPYMTSHPNLGLYVDDEDPMCPHCYSKEIIRDGVYKDAVYTTNVSVFPAYRCLKCGATPRGRKTIVSKEKRDGLLVSTVR